MPVGKIPHRFHTLAGPVIDPESDLLAKGRVNKIPNSCIPEKARDIRPDNEYELHFDAIKPGRGTCRKINKKARDEIIYKTSETIAELKPIAIASTAISQGQR